MMIEDMVCRGGEMWGKIGWVQDDTSDQYI